MIGPIQNVAFKQSHRYLSVYAGVPVDRLWGENPMPVRSTMCITRFRKEEHVGDITRH